MYTRRKWCKAVLRRVPVREWRPYVVCRLLEAPTGSWSGYEADVLSSCDVEGLLVCMHPFLPRSDRTGDVMRLRRVYSRCLQLGIPTAAPMRCSSVGRRQVRGACMSCVGC